MGNVEEKSQVYINRSHEDLDVQSRTTCTCYASEQTVGNLFICQLMKQ